MYAVATLRSVRCALGPQLSTNLRRRFPVFPSSSTTSIRFKSSPTRAWGGLESWRAAPPVKDRSWGPTGPSPPPNPPSSRSSSASSLAEFAALVLSTPDPSAKSHLSHLAYSTWYYGNFPIGSAAPLQRPARPANPVLVTPKEVPSHKRLAVPLNAYLLHNLAHVELNAIDLAWDTVARFSPYLDDLGEQFFADFARVADDESRHFSWCSQRLAELGFRYINN